MKSGVPVEKVPFRCKWPKFEGYKMSRDPRRSLITHPVAILFFEFSQNEFFNRHRRCRKHALFLRQETSGGAEQFELRTRVKVSHARKFEA